MTTIRARRVRLGLTQSALARRSGVSRHALIRAEIDEGDVRPETLQRLARALDQIEADENKPAAASREVTVEVLLPDGARLSFTGPPGAPAREAAMFLRMHRNDLRQR